MIKQLDNFYLSLEEPIQGCLLALRTIILKQDENISETLKWGIPCFCYKNRMFCFLSYEPKTQEPYLLVVEGFRLQHPLLIAAGRKRMKHISFDPEEDLPIESILEILNAALELYRNGTIKVK